MDEDSGSDDENDGNDSVSLDLPAFARFGFTVAFTFGFTVATAPAFGAPACTFFTPAVG